MALLPALAVCLGASLGALARWQLALWLNSPASWLPAGTLVANLAGGAVVGLALAAIEAHPQIDPLWRLALVTGFLGALTTFSTFSAETILLLQQGRILPAMALSLLHLAGSLLLTWAGLVLGRAVF
jgi:fluoride exporter